MPAKANRESSEVYLAVEFIVLYVFLPFVIATSTHGRLAMSLLWAIAAGCLIILFLDGKFNKRELTWTRTCNRMLLKVIGRFVVLALLMTVILVIFRPELLFRFPLRRPQIWALVMALYPLLSVIPQTIIYRAFLFHRYRRLLVTPAKRLFVAALAFSVLHVVFWNVWAILFTLAGGYVFAGTYERSRSVLLSAFEHALYGSYVFTIGWGYYLSTAGSTRLAALLAQ